MPVVLASKEELARFWINMSPPTTTHQMKKIRVVNGKPIMYEPDNVKDARQKLMANLAKYRPEQPYEGPLRLIVIWCFKLPNKDHKNGDYRTSKPDLDNLQKLLKDVMTDLKFWKDDAIIASEVAEKYWSTKPGLTIGIERI